MSEQTKISVRLDRARWRSRRGLLELELLLKPFVEGPLAQLPASCLDSYERLLEEDDVDVHEWILERSPVPDPYREIVAAIRGCLKLA